MAEGEGFPAPAEPPTSNRDFCVRPAEGKGFLAVWPNPRPPIATFASCWRRGRDSWPSGRTPTSDCDLCVLLAEGEGFEPPVALRRQRFSRPPP